MATYLELRALFGHGELKNRVEVACLVAAEAIRTEAGGTENHANRVIWARRVFAAPGTVRDRMLMALLAANKGAEVAAITEALDDALQARVDAAVDLFADGS